MTCPARKCPALKDEFSKHDAAGKSKCCSSKDKKHGHGHGHGHKNDNKKSCCGTKKKSHGNGCCK